MKPVILRMDSKGKISTESMEVQQDKYAIRLARMRDRRDPMGIEYNDMTLENESIKAEINSIVMLHSIATSLESITEIMEDMLETNGMSPENINRMEELANEIAGPLGEDPILLTDAQGVATTESLAQQARVAFASISAGVKRLANSVSQYYLRYRGLSTQLHRQLKTQKAELIKIKYSNAIEIIPTPAMAGICDENGTFDLAVAAQTLRAFTGDVKWTVNILAPETVNLMAAIGQWLDNFEVTDDNAVDASFSKVLDISAPLPPTDWSVVPNSAYGRQYKVARSNLLFSNHYFVSLRPLNPATTDTSYLAKDLMTSEITFGAQSDSPVVADDAVVTIDSLDTVLKMIDDAMEILDFHDVFNLHSVRLVKELNGMINAGQRLMQRAGSAGELTDASMAKLVLAIQAPQSISLKAQSPFRDVLYESIRVITGVISLAATVKTAESSAE